MTVLFLSSWYPNRVLPTLGNFVQKHAEAVALKSDVIALFVCSDANCKTKYEVEESTINQVYTINVYYSKVSHNIPVVAQVQKLTRYMNAYRKGLKLVFERAGKVDIVQHNILYPAGIIAWYLKKSKNIPYVISENWTGYLPYKNITIGFWQKAISRIIARNATYILPVSNELKIAMQNLGFHTNYELVYNVTNTRLFYPQVPKITGQKFKFVHISTLDDPHKNITGMLETASELARQNPDFEFWFIGDGDSHPHIQTAKKLGIYNTIAFFDGTKTTAEVAEIMRTADCFVLFSNYENLPCVIIEAMASGIPVVASTVGGTPDHISESNGLLVPPRDKKALLEALAKVMENVKTNRYDAQQLNRYATENFSYESVCDRLHSIYSKTLNKQYN